MKILDETGAVVTDYGADHAQIANVVGLDESYGEAVNTENLDYYGPWTQIYTPYTDEVGDGPSQVELDSQAARNVTGRSPVPFEVRVPDNSSIQLDDTLRITDLVAGVQMPLMATLNTRKRNQNQKLDRLVVRETQDGETIQVTLSPSSRPDDDVEAP